MYLGMLRLTGEESRAVTRHVKAQLCAPGYCQRIPLQTPGLLSIFVVNRGCEVGGKAEIIEAITTEYSYHKCYQEEMSVPLITNSVKISRKSTHVCGTSLLKGSCMHSLCPQTLVAFSVLIKPLRPIVNVKLKHEQIGLDGNVCLR